MSSGIEISQSVLDDVTSSTWGNDEFHWNLMGEGLPSGGNVINVGINNNDLADLANEILVQQTAQRSAVDSLIASEKEYMAEQSKLHRYRRNSKLGILQYL